MTKKVFASFLEGGIMLRRAGFYCLLAAFTVGNLLSYDFTVGNALSYDDVLCNTNLNPQGTFGEPVGPSNVSGCLTAAGGGLTPDPGLTAWADFTIAWQITPASGGYQYQYTFTDPTATRGLSHVIIGLSENCKDDTCIWGASSTDASIGEWGDEGNSNSGIPGSLWGIKFNTSNSPTTFSVSFVSNRIPVWQNVYAADGNYEGGWTYIYNTGFGKTGYSYYIAAPDSVVPEPGFYGMLAAGLGGLYLALRRRR